MESKQLVIRDIETQIDELEHKVAAVNGGIKVNLTLIKEILIRTNKNERLPGDDAFLYETREELKRQNSALNNFNNSIAGLYKKLKELESEKFKPTENPSQPEKI